MILGEVRRYAGVHKIRVTSRISQAQPSISAVIPAAANVEDALMINSIPPVSMKNAENKRKKNRE